MNCPHCHGELPVDYAGAKCPQCGAAFSPERGVYAASTSEPSPAHRFANTDPTIKQPAPAGLEPEAQRRPPEKFRTIPFFLLLLGPPVLTLLAAALGGDSEESASIPIGLLSGGAGGIACGILLGRRIGRTWLTKIMLGLMLVAVMAPVCIFLCFMGCTLGGWKLNIR